MVFQRLWARLNRTQWRVVALALTIIFIGIGFGVGFSVSSSSARALRDQQSTRNLNAFTKWQMRITAGFSKAMMASVAVGGFCTGFADSPANMTALSNSSDRVRFLPQSAWLKIAQDIWETIPGMRSLEIQSGGVLSQNYPILEEEIGLDVYNLPTDHNGYLEVIEGGAVKILGPGPLWSGGTGIFFRYPVYSASVKNASTFWGTGNVVLQVEQFLTSMEIDRMIVEDNMQYLMWYWDGELHRDVDVLVSDKSMRDKIRYSGMVMELPVAETGKAAYFAIYPSEGFLKDTMPSSDIAAIVVVTLVGAFLASLVASAILFGFLVGRSHGNAPKDATKPFTLVFTDIQSSTSLWAELPEDMSEAMVEHHRLIRSLIKKHKGYEVKTIGDSFMIAFKEADDAVRLAAELQYVFFNCDKFPKSIDECYLAFDREKLISEEIYDESTIPSDHHFYNLSVRLSPQQYARRWRGLRVRCGINTAFGDIQRDEVADSYDYYGTVANTAARVESVAHGGQVVITEGTLNALSSVKLEVVDHLMGDEGDEANSKNSKDGHKKEEGSGSGGVDASKNGPIKIRRIQPRDAIENDAHDTVVSDGKYNDDEGLELEKLHHHKQLTAESATRPTRNNTAIFQNSTDNSRNGSADGMRKNDKNNHGNNIVSSARNTSSLNKSSPIPLRFAKALGSVELRGLADPVKLYELQVVAGRKYPPLRLERQLDDDLADGLSDHTTTNNTTRTTTNNNYNTAVASVSASQSDTGTAYSNVMHAASATDTQSIRSAGRGGHDGGQINYPKINFAAVLLTLVSSMAAAQKVKSLKRFADAWRINTSTNTQTFASADAVRATGNATLISILALANGDAALAGMVYLLSNRLAKVASARLSRVADLKAVVGADGKINLETQSVCTMSVDGGGGRARTNSAGTINNTSRDRVRRYSVSENGSPSSQSATLVGAAAAGLNVVFNNTGALAVSAGGASMSRSGGGGGGGGTRGSFSFNQLNTMSASGGVGQLHQSGGTTTSHIAGTVVVAAQRTDSNQFSEADTDGSTALVMRITAPEGERGANNNTPTVTTTSNSTANSFQQQTTQQQQAFLPSVVVGPSSPTVGQQHGGTPLVGLGFTRVASGGLAVVSEDSSPRTSNVVSFKR